MNNPEDVIREALAVRDEGAEPIHEATEYEEALLHEARLQQKPTESLPQAIARVARDGNDHVDALAFAAQRVRDREDALGLGKRATPSPVADDAERVAKSGSSPRYTRSDYEDEMMSLSKQLARPGEDTVSAFARLAGEGDFDALYAAGEQADIAEERTALSKGVSRDDRFDRLLLDLAKMRRTPGETIEQAATRLLNEDATVRDAYAAVNGG